MVLQNDLLYIGGTVFVEDTARSHCEGFALELDPSGMSVGWAIGFWNDVLIEAYSVSAMAI
jgi:hypothetical protein